MQKDPSLRLSLRRLERAARRAERRARLAAALASGAKVLPIALAAAAIALVVAKVRPSVESEQAFFAVSAVGVLAVLGFSLRAALERRPAWAGAIELDRHHGLGGRIQNALAFARLPPAERTPLMQLAIDDALENARELAPRRAVVIPVPREAGLVALLAGGLVVLALLEVQVTRQIPLPPAPPPSLMSADDVELFREVGRELTKASENPEQKAAVTRYNRLIEDIAERRVDRQEVFRRLGEIERDLGQDLAADREALEEGLDAVARELAKSGLTREAAQALDDNRLADAEQALRELAAKLKNKRTAPSQAELERLRKALERAGKQSQERLAAIEARRRELAAERESLLKKKREQADAGAEQNQKKLDENERKLERLERESQRARRSAGALSELDRELARAAQDLQKEMQEGAKGLEKSAESLNRMAKQELSDEQKRELIRRLKELREVLRQQSQGGEGRKERLERFGQRARGQKPGDGKDGKDGEGGQKGGKGSKDVRIRLGRGTAEVELPGSGNGQGKGDEQGGDKQGGGERGGSEWGTGHDPTLAGDPTKLDGKTQDVSAAGIDSGEGTASAEVIYGAAERGFTSKGYREIFTEYETVAEQVIEKDQIPSGYRFYVRRYFQLIRPRE